MGLLQRVPSGAIWQADQLPTGLKRLLLDQRCEPLNVLQSNQRWDIQNQRVNLVDRSREAVALIRRIFLVSVGDGGLCYKIAGDLSRVGIPLTSRETELP